MDSRLRGNDDRGVGTTPFPRHPRAGEGPYGLSAPLFQTDMLGKDASEMPASAQAYKQGQEPEGRRPE